ncbi:hypothetical protein V3C99_015831 [Haemonchus contortus]
MAKDQDKDSDRSSQRKRRRKQRKRDRSSRSRSKGSRSKSERSGRSTRSKKSRSPSKSSRSERSTRSRRSRSPSKSDRSERSSRSRKSRNSSKSDRSRKSRRKRSSRRRTSKNAPRRQAQIEHRCSIQCDKCPKQVRRRALMDAAARDRELRQDRSVLQMMNEHAMTETMMLQYMQRQKAYGAMRSLALHLEILCIVIVGFMGIFAQRLFNTRGDLNFYLTQMTFELFLLAIVVYHIASPSYCSRFINIIVFVFAVGFNFCHILIIVRTRGTFWKCHENEVMLQHCLFYAVPTHYHTLYTSTILLILHLAIVLATVSAAIFYDGSLDYFMDRTSGTPQWVTDLPLHQHEYYDESRRKVAEAKLTIDDLPPGTTIIREQEVRSVKLTRMGRDGKQTSSPEDVTVTRSYTINAPGMGSATGRRSWKKPSDAGDSKKIEKSPCGLAQKPVDANVKAGKAENLCPIFPCGGAPCGGAPTTPQKTTDVQQRKAAGKDAEAKQVETLPCKMSTMPPLMSQIANLNNKNLLQKQSDYMY